VSFWIGRELADDLETVSLIERRGLERVRVKSELRATMMSRVFLRRSQQPAPGATTPHVLADPKRLDPTRLAPFRDGVVLAAREQASSGVWQASPWVACREPGPVGRCSTMASDSTLGGPTRVM
jgi:hypothetical protein